MKWIVPILLIGVIYAADQIRINRPDHKYRLTMTVETPSGTKSVSGILSVRPNRSYGGTGTGSSFPQTRGDALVLDLGEGRSLVALLAYGEDGANFDDPSFLPTRLLGANDRRIGFRDVKKFAGAPALPVPAPQRPALLSLTNLTDPKSARRVNADNLEASFGKGFRFRDLTLDIVANGFWPIDFGGALGEPVTRGIDAKLPWLKTPDGAAAALQAAGVKIGDGFAAEAAFSR